MIPAVSPFSPCSVSLTPLALEIYLQEQGILLERRVLELLEDPKVNIQLMDLLVEAKIRDIELSESVNCYVVILFTLLSKKIDDQEVISDFLNFCPEKLFVRKIGNTTALGLALANRVKIEVLQVLIRAGASLYLDGREIIYEALSCGAPKELFSLLLSTLDRDSLTLFMNSRGVKFPFLIEILNYRRENLRLGKQAVDLEVLQLFIKEGATLSRASFYDRHYALKVALESQSLTIDLYDCITEEFDKDQKQALLNYRDFSSANQTILHFAVLYNSKPEILAHFLLKGAFPMQDRFGKTPLHYVFTEEDKIQKFLPVFLYHLQEEQLREQVNLRDNEGHALLFYALNGRAPTAVIKHLVQNGAVMNLYEPGGTLGLTAVHYAILIEAPLERLKELFSGMDKVSAEQYVNAQDLEGYTPLHHAANRNSPIEVIRFLLSIGARADIRSHQGESCLHTAFLAEEEISSEQLEILILSLDPKIQKEVVNWRDSDKGYTALDAFLQSSLYPSLEKIAILVKYGANCQDLLAAGMAPFHLAALLKAPKEEYAEALEPLSLEERKDRLNRPERYRKEHGGGTILHELVRSKASPDIIEMLVDYGAENCLDDEGLTPLHDIDPLDPQAVEFYMALLKGQEVQVKQFLLNQLDKEKKSIIFRAIELDAPLPVIAYLLEQGSRIDLPQGEHDLTLLHLAVLIASPLPLCQLILRGMDPGLRKKVAVMKSVKGHIPLHLAVRKGASPELCTLLLEGLNEEETRIAANNKSDAEAYLLHDAVYTGIQEETLSILIEAGAEVDILMDGTINGFPTKMTIFWSALNDKNSPEVFETLIASLPAERSRFLLNLKVAGIPILYMAFYKKVDLEVLRILIGAGASLKQTPDKGSIFRIQIQDSDREILGHTFLHYLAYSNQKYPSLELWSALLEPLSLEEAREILNLQDQEGHTPLSLAWEYRNYPLMELLVRYGASHPKVSDNEMDRIIVCGKEIVERWKRFTFVNDLSERIVECSYYNPFGNGVVLALQGASDENNGFSMYDSRFYSHCEFFAQLSERHQETYFNVISDDKEAVTLLEAQKKVSTLVIEGHGPGANLKEASSVLLGKNRYLSVGNQRWIEAAKNKLTNPSMVFCIACGLGREEAGGIKNLCQELADNVPGVTVITSGGDSFSDFGGTRYFPDENIIKFFKESGEDQTVVYRAGIRATYPDYLQLL